MGGVIRDCQTDCLEESKLTTPSAAALNILSPRFTFIVKDCRGALGGIIIGLNSYKFELLGHMEGKFNLSVTIKRHLDN